MDQRSHRQRYRAFVAAVATGGWVSACVAPEDPIAASDTVDAASTSTSTSDTGTESASSTSVASAATSVSSTADDVSSTSAAESTGEGSTTAVEPVCGDGVVDEGEECDLGPDNDDEAACTYSCKVASCGDHLVHAGVEACDDGNNDGEYGGCLPDCSARAPHCGDGVLQEDHETCERALQGELCGYFCDLRECSTLDLHDGTDASCPPEAQVNAAISGTTPIGAFSATFAAQSWGYYGSYWVFVVAEAYQPEALCEPQSYLLIAGDAPIYEVPGEVGAHVMVSIAGEVAFGSGTLALLADDYFKIDASPECVGSTSLTISVAGDGWSLGGAAETSCCRSSNNAWVNQARAPLASPWRHGE